MIKFGTDGWRGIIADEFTFENLRIVTQALADYLRQVTAKNVAVGFDRRFMSDMFALEAAKVLAANGLIVFLSEKPVTTPVISFTVKNLGLDAGVMITASHNPYIYNGFKLKGKYGGSATPEITAAVEKLCGINPVKTVSAEDPLIKLFNPDGLYLNKVSSLVNIEKIENSGLKIVFDPMFGSGCGYLHSLFPAFPSSRLIEINGEANPSFGGINPEPIDQNLSRLKTMVLSEKADIGLAVDGDGDRIGAVDSNGNFVNAHQIFALLLKHLVENRGWTGTVVKTVSTTSMLEKQCSKYGLFLYETPIGFKYICELFQKEEILIGGEESGGFGFKNHIPERDGLLSALLLLELLTVTEKSLSLLLNELMTELGSHFYKRIDIHLSTEQISKLLSNLNAVLPDNYAGYPITGLNKTDGYKFFLGGHSWILFRLSGTEPLLRVYAEAPSEKILNAILESAEKFIQDL